MKHVTHWFSDRLNCNTQLVRWGHYGRPMLLFPTAGGDAEEVERNHLIGAIEPWISAGKIKVYSVESISGRTWLTNDNVAHCLWVQTQFDEYLIHEAIPAIVKIVNLMTLNWFLQVLQSGHLMHCWCCVVTLVCFLQRSV